MALTHFRVNETERLAIYRIVAAVLNLGNISFEDSSEDSRGLFFIRTDSVFSVLKCFLMFLLTEKTLSIDEWIALTISDLSSKSKLTTN